MSVELKINAINIVATGSKREVETTEERKTVKLG
jgi:hypothetical protein